jgi:competence protein ComK
MNNMPSLLDAFALIPRFGEFGKPYSIILKNTEEVEIPFSAVKLLDCQLRQMGSSWKGAKEAASFLLGSSSMFSFALKVQPFINIWFPSESHRNETCVYFALHQIEKFEADGDEYTIVHGKGNYSVTIPVPCSKFKIRYDQALKYLAINYLNQFLYATSYSTRAQQTNLNCAELQEEYTCS